MKPLSRLSAIIFSCLLPACTLQAAVLYVDTNNSNPVAPYTNWATAARVIQDAVDVASAGDEILATNGIYRTGGRAVYGTLSNRVAVTKPLMLRSVNGPEATFIQGEKYLATSGPGAVRCVYLTNGACLAGFTLTNGATYAGPDTQNYKNAGGGLWCESTNAVVSNCVIVANSAYARGAGAYQGTLQDCVLSANEANDPGNFGGQGGGAYNALLVNCTLVGNSASAGGGAYAGVLVDCSLYGNSTTYLGGGGANSAALTGCLLVSNISSYQGGGSFSCALSNCRIQANSALQGGGVYQGTLTNCTISANTAKDGGGAVMATLNGCRLDNNVAMNVGGGSAAGTLFFCTYSGNRAALGGGDGSSHLSNCTLIGNSASTNGGGAYQSFLTNCSVANNVSGCNGGGVCESSLNSCTLIGNSAILQGGGACWSSLTNCIVYYNKALTDANHFESTLDYCFTTPLPADGTHNFTDDPELASISHLSISSPCRGAGNATVVVGTDIDGQLWAAPPSVGCDEFHSDSVTNSLTVGIVADYTNIVAGFDLNLEAVIGGQTRYSWWDFGDGTAVSNRPYASHRWDTVGDYAVVLTAYNDTWPGGISSTVLVRVVQRPTYYVARESTNPVPPYTSWATAANDIQAAVDAAPVAGALVLVSNGVYSTGGRIVDGTLSNRVAVTKPLLVQSVNGPEVTTIRGYQVVSTTNGSASVRCVYLADKAELSGFTLTCGATGDTSKSPQETSGGALWCAGPGASVSNCVFSLNSAMFGGGGVSCCGNVQSCIFLNNSAQFGGGAWASSLKNCALDDNHAFSGGGVYNGTVDHCILTSNSADSGGGAYLANLTACQLNGNSAVANGGGTFLGSLFQCNLRGNSAALGGGAAFGSLNNCAINQNHAASSGGGVYWCDVNNSLLISNVSSFAGGASIGTLNNCTLVANSALISAGGTQSTTLNNCIVYYNVALNDANYSDSTLNYCCTAPLPVQGSNNFTNAPLFVDLAGDDLRLQSNSPCINAGWNEAGHGKSDFGGEPRVVAESIDVGAHEFQDAASVISYAWLERYNLATDGSADYADPDSDGMNTWQEWYCDTIPTNKDSVFFMLPLSNDASGVTVTWSSSPNRTYRLERATELPFEGHISTIQTNVQGQIGITTYRDTSANGALKLFYRIAVQR